MLLMMLERNEPIQSVVFFDTGWEFPEMIEHIDKLEKYTGLDFVRLKPLHPFDYVLSQKPIIARKGPFKGLPYREGNGWPAMRRRWCTRLKIGDIDKHLKQQVNFVSCIGFASDEEKRVPDATKTKFPERYPLIEWDVTEKMALEYCYTHGFNWGGLYELFGRVSCFCCPLQRIGELKALREHRPALWVKMLKMDAGLKDNRGFRGYKTVQDMEDRFAKEDAKEIELILGEN